MLGFELIEELPRRTGLSFARILQALLDSFFGLSAGGDIEQALIDLRVLHDSRSLAFHSEHDEILGALYH